MTNQLAQIPVAPYKQMVEHWNTARASYASAVNLLNGSNENELHAFHLPADRQIDLPSDCTKVHTYLICDARHHNLQLVLIPDVYDLAIANGATTIAQSAICTLDYVACSVPTPTHYPYSERIAKWQRDKNLWLQSVIQNSEHGVVRLFEVPVTDFEHVRNLDTEIFLALKQSDEEESSVEVILRSTESEEHYYDISTPCPPYGSDSGIFGLLT